MLKFRLILFFSVCFFALKTVGQKNTTDENELYRLIMQHRRKSGLPVIPLSSALSKVARIHAKDLMENYTAKAGCNMHSWSDKGNWIPVCYSPDHRDASLMWSKPSELSTYKGNGYEIAYFHSERAIPTEALESWKQSDGHHDLILNRNSWTREWNAVGIGINGNYALVWFGFEKDNKD
jgi:hypothetical protein